MVGLKDLWGLSQLNCFMILSIETAGSLESGRVWGTVVCMGNLQWHSINPSRISQTAPETFTFSFQSPARSPGSLHTSSPSSVSAHLPFGLHTCVSHFHLSLETKFSHFLMWFPFALCDYSAVGFGVGSSERWQFSDCKSNGGGQRQLPGKQLSGWTEAELRIPIFCHIKYLRGLSHFYFFLSHVTYLFCCIVCPLGTEAKRFLWAAQEQTGGSKQNAIQINSSNTHST